MQRPTKAWCCKRPHWQRVAFLLFLHLLWVTSKHNGTIWSRKSPIVTPIPTQTHPHPYCFERECTWIEIPNRLLLFESVKFQIFRFIVDVVRLWYFWIISVLCHSHFLQNHLLIYSTHILKLLLKQFYVYANSVFFYCSHHGIVLEFSYSSAGHTLLNPYKRTLECLSPTKMYMAGDIHIQTLSPEGQTSSQGPKG